MAVGSVGNECPKFNSIIFGEDGKYIATKHGNTVLIRGKDGSVRTTDVDTFMKFLAAALPKMKEPPKLDTFKKRSPMDLLVKAEEINKNDSPLTALGKTLCNTTKLQERKESDGLLESFNKSIHNFGAVMFNPMAAVEFWTNPGKY